MPYKSRAVPNSSKVEAELLKNSRTHKGGIENFSYLAPQFTLLVTHFVNVMASDVVTVSATVTVTVTVGA